MQVEDITESSKSPGRKILFTVTSGYQGLCVLCPCPGTLKLITEPIELNEMEEQNLSRLVKGIFFKATNAQNTDDDTWAKITQHVCALALSRKLLPSAETSERPARFFTFAGETVE